ncbi:NtaA/DmoA family FMN-dependent monooxygenase [Variovorax paradoxus]|uniref:NtaA/DmoA family FMN-dependent monooxygenase n=1 Tax=Variovorax paradoxus TaxID=34073 RepID=UPI0019318D90|nr:NtaA/DmoA family FMN-dependent monooxygenase [Variovorax paradoxus]
MNAPSRQLRIAAFIMPGFTSQSWRHPALPSDFAFNLAQYVECAQIAERALFDTVFVADSATFPEAPDAVVERMASVSLFEPLTLLTAIAARTQRVGLIYTASVSDYPPALLARQVASLDHLSGGRAGWNLVTTYGPSSRQLGLPADKSEDDSYARAAEFVEVVRGLWDGFEDDAILGDKASGLYADLARIHRLEHDGRYYPGVRGPLRIARPVQGHPVIAQAGASQAGRDFAAQTADLVFCNCLSIESGRAFYADLKGRVAAAGRNPHSLKIMPGCSIVWGETDALATEKFEQIASLFPIGVAVENLMLDLHGHPLDSPFPTDVAPARFSVGHQKEITQFAVANGLTLRQTAQRLAVGNKHRVLVGSTQTIADDLEHWLRTEACDGITLMAPFLAQGYAEFADHVVPELQRRGLFRSAYDGSTLREHLGLPRPPNRWR